LIIVSARLPGVAGHRRASVNIMKGHAPTLAFCRRVSRHDSKVIKKMTDPCEEPADRSLRRLREVQVSLVDDDKIGENLQM
jgi:hypothetical protein